MLLLLLCCTKFFLGVSHNMRRSELLGGGLCFSSFNMLTSAIYFTV